MLNDCILYYCFTDGDIFISQYTTGEKEALRAVLNCSVSIKILALVIGKWFFILLH
uniref:KIAA0586 n=1 Tax=Terrapene triunguis TaxID=2587831 RepID=A0A674K163_9SAUR